MTLRPPAVILGYDALLTAMFEAGEGVLGSTIDVTADVVEHRHGADAGAAARGVGVAAKDGVKAGITFGKVRAPGSQ